MAIRAILSIVGQNPLYLGSFSESEALELVDAVKDFEFFEVLEDTDIGEIKLVANPAEDETSAFTAKEVEAALKRPLFAFRRAPLNFDRCTIGRPEMCEDHQVFPISYVDVQDISMREVAAHLGAFIPRTRKKMPLQILKHLDGGNKYIPESMWNVKEMDGIAFALIDQVLRQNAKMAKSKVPSILGLGTPYDDLLNEAPTAGSFGLSFLPNYTLLQTSPETGEKGFLPIVREYANSTVRAPSSDINDKRKSRYAAYVASRLCVDALQNVKGTACISSSRGCRKACLVNSGQRYATKFDIFEERTEDTDIMQNRMLLGFWQSAFIANPYYFLRLLIEAIYTRSIEHETQLCAYNIEASLSKEEGAYIDPEKYLAYLPLSVRLNVYTDYPWEMIYPDLFTLFSKENVNFTEVDSEGREVRSYGDIFVQFYDYTKISGRWPSNFRRSVWNEAGLEIPKSLQNSLLIEDRFALEETYQLPDNYHLTFSFNGTDASKKESRLANLAGQNATFVFSSQQIINSTLLKLFESTKTEISGFAGSALKTRFQTFATSFRLELKKVLGGRDVVSGSTVSEENLLPDTYMGYRVISGDTYDLRFLDSAIQRTIQGIGLDSKKKLDPVIVGLKWKAPDNLKISVDGQNFSMTPINAAVALDVAENVDIASGFAQSRVGLGTNIRLDGKLVTLFLFAEDSSLEATRRIYEQLASLEPAQIVTFATETGRVINDGNSPEEISEQLQLLLSQMVDNTIM